VREDEHAGAVGRLDPSRHDAPCARERGLLVDDLGCERQLDWPGVVTQDPKLADRVAHRRQHVRRHPESLAQPRVERGRAEGVELRARSGRGVGREAGAEPVAQERVDGAHPEGSGVARPHHALVVPEQPCQLARREVGIERQAAAAADLLLAGGEPSEDLLRALVLPDDDRRERDPTLGVPREDRLALVVEPTRDHFARRVVEQLGHGVDHRAEHLLAVLLDPSGPGMAGRLVAPGLAHGPKALVEQRRLDRRRALVDPQHEPGAHVPTPDR
jgi:hypothetical protein